MLGLDIEEDAEVYAKAAWDYYHGSGQSDITDETYDALTGILVVQWDEIPEAYQRVFISPDRIKVTGMHITWPVS